MNRDLFAEAQESLRKFQPLAELARPKEIGEVVGQRHLLGEDAPLTLAFESQEPHSMIFWGPPGVGKTTLAHLISDQFDAHFIALSAVFSGVKEVRAAIDEAKQYASLGRATFLFIDEIHRFNKSQQDALLPYVESGEVYFIGATTENPSFEVNSALLSRSSVYQLEALSEEEIAQLFLSASKRFYPEIEWEEGAVALLSRYADGDGRRALNFTQQLATLAIERKIERIDADFAASLLRHQPRRFDKGGDAFYDQISAMHKSIRGSNPDAALYWFTVMLLGGADPRYLGRRILMIAWEDIGLADPRGIQIATDALTTFERLGAPEGELALAEAVIYLSVAAKSNAAYAAFNQMKAFVEQDQTREVPLHLRNAPTALMEELGHGREYRYAHNEPHGYAAGENYFPEGVEVPKCYHPTGRGLEGRIEEKLAFLKQLDERANQF